MLGSAPWPVKRPISNRLARMLAYSPGHLMEDLDYVVSNHLPALKPAQAVVVELGTQHSQARGVLRHFSTLDAVNLHL